MEHTLPKDPQSNLITDRAAIFNMAWKQHDISYRRKACPTRREQRHTCFQATMSAKLKAMLDFGFVNFGRSVSCESNLVDAHYSAADSNQSYYIQYMDNISVEIKNHNFSASLLRVLPFEDEKSVRIVLLAQFTSRFKLKFRHKLVMDNIR